MSEIEHPPVSSANRVLVGLLAIQLIVFLVSLPGFGIETRKFTQFAAWAGPIFLVLTLVVFTFGASGIALTWRRPRTAAYLAVGMGVSALAAILLDLSKVGGPAPPTGPLILAIVGIVIAIFQFGFAGAALRVRISPSTSPMRDTGPPPRRPPLSAGRTGRVRLRYPRCLGSTRQTRCFRPRSSLSTE